MLLFPCSSYIQLYIYIYILYKYCINVFSREHIFPAEHIFTHFFVVSISVPIIHYYLIYSCFDKGCPTEKHKSVHDNTERYDGLWLFTVASSSSRVFSAMEGGAMNTCLRVLKETMDSELLTCLLKFIEYFPDYLSALSRTLLRFFWTTFVETAVYIYTQLSRNKH